MILDVALSHFELFIRHVDADNMPRLTDQAGNDIAIAPGAAAKVEHAEARHGLGQNQTAAVIAGEHLVMDIGQDRLGIIRHRIRRAAGIGLQILALAEGFAIIITHRGLNIRIEMVICHGIVLSLSKIVRPLVPAITQRRQSNFL